MWIIKWIISAILVVLIIGFAVQNTDQVVSLTFIKWQSINLPLWVVMYASFVCGMLFWLLVSIFRVIALKTENRKIKKDLKKTADELNKLRNVSVNESLEPVANTTSVSKGGVKTEE